jgi:NAD dependent epimerase/dehydratase family enzyme
VINKNCLGIYNAVSPEPTTNKALTLAIAKQLNRLIFFPPIPKILMKIVLGERHVLLFDSQNVSSKKIENQGFKFKYFNLQSYLSSLFKST